MHEELFVLPDFCRQPLAREIMRLYNSECKEIADLLNEWCC